MNKNTLGIYIHIPFCIKKCNYCDFCSFPNSSNNVMERYSLELVKRIKEFAQKNPSRAVDTVYFGGGTPTLLSKECFEKIFSALQSSFEIADDAEITVECNPASIDRERLAALRKIGINRISIGLQSTDPNELSLLGRIHSFDDFRNTFEDARAVGFDNISIDLMYGIPNQTLKSFEKSLKDVVALSPEHISAYALKIEEGTAFYSMVDSLVLPDENTEAELYELCNSVLSNSGYCRYEISNFAKLNRESRHNLKYWSLDDYIGFGVAAHSCFEGVRFGNSRDIDAFISGEDICDQYEEISESERAAEYIMLGMRLACGINLDEYREIFGKELKEESPCINDFIRGGFIIEKDRRIAFTTKGFLVSNSILSEIIPF